MKVENMIAANRADCSGCEACANICPKNAIEMTRDAEGFAYPKINPKLCIKCGRCDKVCPALSIKEKNLTALPETFVAIYPDNKILRHSSSGGVFTALSEIIFRSGGIVFGVAFDKNWRVLHSAARNADELENLRGSKYVQDRIGNVYRQVQDELKSKKVLFSGTPCQCAGLKHFLGKNPDNLLTVEVICHGAPSPALWESYIDFFGYAHEIKHVNFRSKRMGWKNFCVEINFSDQGRYCRPIGFDIYGKNFLDNLTLRPACSSCQFRFPNGQADLTIGDAWGIEAFAPEMFDNRGVSVVFVHTPKGKTFLEQSNLMKKKVSFTEAVKHNPSFIIPAQADPRREAFFAEIAGGADKFAVMEKYFYQEVPAPSEEKQRQSQLDYIKTIQDAVKQIRQCFEKKILVVAMVEDDDEQKILNYLSTPQFQNYGMYFLRNNNAGSFVVTEIFSGLSVEIKNTNEIFQLVNAYNISEIHVDESLERIFPNLSSWLDSSGLPIEHVSLKAD